MNKIFDSSIAVQTTEIPRNLTVGYVIHQGKNYVAIGSSAGEKLSLGERVTHALAIIGMIVGSIFTAFIPFLFKAFRNELFSRMNELSVNHKINIHYEQFEGDGDYIVTALATDFFGFYENFHS